MNITLLLALEGPALPIDTEEADTDPSEVLLYRDEHSMNSTLLLADGADTEEADTELRLRLRLLSETLLADRLLSDKLLDMDS